MPFLYELAVLGMPSDQQVADLQHVVADALELFHLHLGRDVGWHVRPERFDPDQQTASAAVFYGGEGAELHGLGRLINKGVPILPIVPSGGSVADHIPENLRPLNCMNYDLGGPTRVATALLECAGLLPRQRRVFVSYRRDEARQAALQLFDEFSSRHFDVFLDTHGIAPAEQFQPLLWHRLCDSDVLVMLDTPTYFDSRWTSAEFGRALAKCISVLRIGWPDSTPSMRTRTASRAELLAEEIDTATGRLSDAAVARICIQLEAVRSQSVAVRRLNLVSGLRLAIERIGGDVLGVGAKQAVHIRLADQREVIVYPAVGVPTSVSLHDALLDSGERPVAVIYDHVGLHPSWQQHLDWLGLQIKAARWVKSADAAWDFSDW